MLLIDLVFITFVPIILIKVLPNLKIRGLHLLCFEIKKKKEIALPLRTEDATDGHVHLLQIGGYPVELSQVCASFTVDNTLQEIKI